MEGPISICTPGETIKPSFTLQSWGFPILNGAISQKAMASGKPILRPGTSPSRRLNSRVEALGDASVYWRCHGRGDVSRACNIGMGGFFMETAEPQPEPAPPPPHFSLNKCPRHT